MGGKTMLTLHLPSDLLARLESAAAEAGESAAKLAIEAIRQYLDLDEWQLGGADDALEEDEEELGEEDEDFDDDEDDEDVRFEDWDDEDD